MSTALEQASSVTGLVRENVAADGRRTALTFVKSLDGSAPEDDTWSYAALDAETRKVAAWLQTHCAAGDRVLLLYPEGLHFTAAFLGCLYAGMVAVPSSLPGQYVYQRRRVTSIADDAGASAILTDTATLPSVREWAEAEGRTAIALAATDTADLADPDAWTEPAQDRDTLALLQYTSGSTGDPKGVMVSHGNLLHNAMCLTKPFGMTDRSRFGSWIPHYHDMGLMALLIPPLLLGGSCVLMSPTTFLKRPHWWLKMIDVYDLDWSPAPNFAYELCARMVTDEQLAGLDLSRWTYAPNGSEPVQAATLTAFAKRFAPAGFRSDAFAPCYGLAESTVFVSGTGPREPVVRRADAEALANDEFRAVDGSRAGRDVVSNGRADEYDVRIVNPRTLEPLPEGGIGEIWLRGPSVAHGYWGNEEATREVFRARTADGQEGFLRTGDLGTLHDGEILTTGRLKEVLIIRGRNLYPQDIEYELRAQHSELVGLFGAAFSVPYQDQTSGATENLLVITHELRGRHSEEDMAALASAIKRTVSREFGASASGVVLVRRGGIRRTTSGKIQRTAMRDLLLAGGLTIVHLDADPKLRTLLDA
ncbi:fatty acyl-AMP ligase [Streptomyces sp. NPDC050617]|uniref:fatty acyl-AMP ligase n=1 Tax=Streptomyces sp. NPDC050617 TaxID=3154628 RepID=UPI0034311658